MCEKNKKFVSCKFIYKYIIEMSYIQRALSELVRFNFFLIYYSVSTSWRQIWPYKPVATPQYSFWRIPTIFHHHSAFFGKSVSVSYPTDSIPDRPALQTTWVIVAHTPLAQHGTPRTVSGHLWGRGRGRVDATNTRATRSPSGPDSPAGPAQ